MVQLGGFESSEVAEVMYIGASFNSTDLYQTYLNHKDLSVHAF